MSERCPHCSFSPESMSDYCDKHRPFAVSEIAPSGETPRTDALHAKSGGDQPYEAMRIHAKQLERELAEAKKWRGIMTDIADSSQEHAMHYSLRAEAAEAEVAALKQAAILREQQIRAALEKPSSAIAPSEGNDVVAMQEQEMLRILEVKRQADALLRRIQDECWTRADSAPTYALLKDIDAYLDALPRGLAAPQTQPMEAMATALPEDVRAFIESATLEIQRHRSTTEADKDALFQRAYHLYVKYDVEGRRNMNNGEGGK